MGERMSSTQGSSQLGRRRLPRTVPWPLTTEAVHRDPATSYSPGPAGYSDDPAIDSEA